MISFPDDEYLRLVGRLAYTVAHLGGCTLFDLPGREAEHDHGQGCELVVYPG